MATEASDSVRKILEDMVAESDLGGRRPQGAVKRALFYLALLWALFQIYIASPLPYIIGEPFIIGSSQSRMIHYAFAIFLGFCSYPAFLRSSRDRIPVTDWIWASLGAGSSLYMFVLYDQLSHRAAAPLPQDIVVAVIGMICLLEIARRTVGLPLVIIALIFIFYIFAGPYLPDVIAHRGASLARAADHMWLSRDGVFGFTLEISSSVVFLFVMFGSMLDKAGAGNWFIKTSFAMLGHLRGGPAKAAVVSSGLMGVISGSALANVVTTGMFTIPLMKKVGFSAEKAAGIESTSSINGQLMPPVMGAAAFLMTEYVGISYREVVIHAVMPAVISYIGLYYIVHLEAIKLDLPILQKATRSTLARSVTGFAMGFFGLVLMSAVIYLGFSWVKDVFGAASIYVAGVAYAVAYIFLLWISTRVPELQVDDADAEIGLLPEVRPTLLAGLHFLLPLAVLIWCLMIERLSPSYAIYWAIMAMSFIMVTQRPISALMRGLGPNATRSAVTQGFLELIAGFVSGARNMIGIGIALAAAGIIVGAVSLTGLGLVMVSVVELLSGGNILAMLFFTAVISIILGMGLPTTANYVVVASIMAPVVVTLAAQNGFVIPLIAIHLFVFYCGLMSGNTPPVAVDAYAAAALARANPLQTCLQAFYYGIRTIILPFIFVFNPELLLIGVDGPVQVVFVFVISTLAMLLFVASTQRWFFVRNTVFETIALFALSMSLLLPNMMINIVSAPYRSVDVTQVAELATDAPANSLIRLSFEGEDFSGAAVQRVVALPLGKKGLSGQERLMNDGGVGFRNEEGRMLVDDLNFNGAAQKAGVDYDWELVGVEVPRQQISKYWVYLIALIGTVLLSLNQLRRRGTVAPARA